MINEENVTFAISPFYSKAIKLIKKKKQLITFLWFTTPHIQPQRTEIGQFSIFPFP